MYNFDSLRTIRKINGRFSSSELGIIANRPRRGKKRHTLLEDLGLQIASLLSCFLRLYRQSRPVCAASRPWLASASVGARPHRERLRRAKCNNHRSCSPYFYPEREREGACAFERAWTSVCAWECRQCDQKRARGSAARLGHFYALSY